MAENPQQMDIQLFTKNFLSQGNRSDDRGFTQSRAATLNVKSLRQADGSAIVQLGKTTVVCGIKAELAKPKAETPNKGFLIVNIELPPLCSPFCQPGPPSDKAQTASRFISSTFLDNNAVDLEALCIVPDKLAWVLYLDIICLNLDGGLFEAAVLAATASLQNTTLPNVSYDVETGVKKVETCTRIPIKLNAMPLATTFAVFEGAILQDPTAEEEALATGLLTAIDMNNSKSDLALHMPGCDPITPDGLKKCIASAKERTRQLSKLLHAASVSPER